jgi:hypothetical protein
LNSNPLKPARSLRKEIRRSRKQTHAADFGDRHCTRSTLSASDALMQRLLAKSLRKVTGKKHFPKTGSSFGVSGNFISDARDVNAPSPKLQFGEIFAAPTNERCSHKP